MTDYKLYYALGSAAMGVRVNETWGVIDEQIGDGRWVLGDRFSAADIYLYMLTTWLRPARGQPPVETFTNVSRIAAEVEKRPSVQKVYAEWVANGAA